MHIYTLVLGVCATNCYIFTADDTHAVIIDPADRASTIYQTLQKHALVPVAILLTHGHFDHIAALDELISLCGDLPVYAHEKELACLTDTSLNLSTGLFGSPFTSTQAVTPITDGTFLDLAGLSLTILHTPGHTAGSVCYYAKEQNTLLSGDALFAGSIGRTDFPGGDAQALFASLKKLEARVLPDTVIYPGHGESTTLAQELRYNPYLQ